MKSIRIFSFYILAIGLLLNAEFGIGIASAQDDEKVDFLFVQYAESVTLADGKLTLHGVQPETLYFSTVPIV